VPDSPTADGELSLAAVERAHILRVLALAGFNKVRAARDLGITRATLYTKLRAYGVGVGDAAAPTHDAGDAAERR
jgi:DNA-binding NtrC family response regulator